MKRPIQRLYPLEVSTASPESQPTESIKNASVADVEPTVSEPEEDENSVPARRSTRASTLQARDRIKDPRPGLIVLVDHSSQGGECVGHYYLILILHISLCNHHVIKARMLEKESKIAARQSDCWQRYISSLIVVASSNPVYTFRDIEDLHSYIRCANKNYLSGPQS